MLHEMTEGWRLAIIVWGDDLAHNLFKKSVFFEHTDMIHIFLDSVQLILFGHHFP